MHTDCLYAGLADWVASINNMMWFSFSSCEGNSTLVIAVLCSYLHNYIINVN